ncbi:amelogenin, X isoform [Sceloporus undulatus]|uniref:amelogenin, X isoform n=1 Tax=Sceloporus undulatus TaxID=8520 RepID=UPI001C4B1B0D|nr:amelogenin, X isoform [Sceloporus undulatus]
MHAMRLQNPQELRKQQNTGKREGGVSPSSSLTSEPAMRKMEGWTLVMCLLSTTFAIPLPQHPGFINFSYEVMTPLKWYQSLIGHQYPRYSYEPMGGWMHHAAGPMMHQTHFPSLPSGHTPLHQMPPQQPHLNPQMQQPGHNPYVPFSGQNTLIPHFQPPNGAHIQQPLSPHAGEHPMHPQQPGNPIQPMYPQQPANPNQPMFPVQQLPPMVPDTPLESWPAADKTKQEEVD